MISSTSFLNKTALFLIPCLLCLSGEAWGEKRGIRDSHPRAEKFCVAVFPIENLSGTMAPLKEIRRSLMNHLRQEGFRILEEETFDKFMERYRIRYAGGINKALAQAFKKETEADGVLITSLELYSEGYPPKIALTSRLVATGDDPAIRWIEGVGWAGDDSPGILGLGLIEDSKKLVEKTLEKLTSSLSDSFDKPREKEYGEEAKRKFRPKVAYRSDLLDPNGQYSVAVIPFLNMSGRKNAGEILGLQFIRSLKTFKPFAVIEPGVVRDQLLTMRMIIPEGISLANADALLAVLNADLILAANVIEYQDYEGSVGKPKVDFFAQLIEKKSRSVVWSSVSHNEGDDGVFFFDRGKENTAHAMTSKMTKWIGEMMLEGKKPMQAVRGQVK
jgi:hypothetical protein